jgi:hypothetical protein
MHVCPVGNHGLDGKAPTERRVKPARICVDFEDGDVRDVIDYDEWLEGSSEEDQTTSGCAIMWSWIVVLVPESSLYPFTWTRMAISMLSYYSFSCLCRDSMRGRGSGWRS